MPSRRRTHGFLILGPIMDLPRAQMHGPTTGPAVPQEIKEHLTKDMAKALLLLGKVLRKATRRAMRRALAKACTIKGCDETFDGVLEAIHMSYKPLEDLKV